MLRSPPASAGDASSVPELGRSPGEGNGHHSSILAWRIPWIEETGGLQPMGSQRVEHVLVTKLSKKSDMTERLARTHALTHPPTHPPEVLVFFFTFWFYPGDPQLLPTFLFVGWGGRED